MILNTINLNEPVGDMELSWIIASCIFLVAFWVIALWALSRRVRKDRDAHLWPSPAQVEKASPQQIAWWVKNLPIASTDRQMTIIDQIVRRYLDVDVEPEPLYGRDMSRPSIPHDKTRTSIPADECLITNEY